MPGQLSREIVINPWKPLHLLCLPLAVRLPTLTYPLQNVLPVLVQLELCDDALWRSNTDGDWLAVRLFACDSLDVYDVFETVDGSNFALTTLVRASWDDDFVVFADRNGADLKIAGVLAFEVILSCVASNTDYRGQCHLLSVGLPYIVLLTQFLAQRSAHDGASDAGGSAEMRLARLPPRRV